MPIESDGQNISREPQKESLIDSPLQSARNQDVPPPTTAQTTTQDEPIAIKLSKEIKAGERWLIGIGIATLLINSIIALIYWGQLNEMRTATIAATQASNTAAETLTTMQADDVSSDAKFAVQLDKLDASIKQADRLAKATENANTNVIQSDRPWIGAVPIITQFEVGKNVSLGFMFTNSGKRPAFIESTRYRFDGFTTFPADPGKAYFNAHNDRNSTNFVVPGASFIGADTGDTPLAQPFMDALQKGILTYYLFAEVRYKDVRTNEEHITDVCLLFIPRSKTATDQGWRNCPEYNYAN